MRQDLITETASHNYEILCHNYDVINYEIPSHHYDSHDYKILSHYYETGSDNYEIGSYYEKPSHYYGGGNRILKLCAKF